MIKSLVIQPISVPQVIRRSGIVVTVIHCEQSNRLQNLAREHSNSSWKVVSVLDDCVSHIWVIL